MLLHDAAGSGLSTVATPSHGASVDSWTSFAGESSDGGDWCESIRLDARSVALTVGDVAGHGDAVAPMKRVIRNSIVNAIARFRSPTDVLTVANDVVCSAPSETLVTAVVAYLDRPSSTLYLANAGHPPPLLITQRGFSYLSRPRGDLPLGVFTAYSSEAVKVTLEPGTLVVFYTDGVTERSRDPIEGEGELAAAARFAFDRPEYDTARVIADQMFSSERGNDDAAILVLRTWPVGLRYARRQLRRA